MAHAERAHAKLSASSAKRWMACAGSVAAEAEVESHEVSDDNPASREGTAAHELAEWCLKNVQPPEAYPFKAIKVSGHTIEIGDEMREGVRTYLTTVFSALGDTARRLLFIEQRVSLDALNPPSPMYGTADAIIYDPDTRHVHVVDLKYGQGVYVDVTDNEQLLYYALGAKFAMEAKGRDVITATCTIVQPRNHKGDPVRSVEVSADDLEVFASRVLTAARATQEPNAPRVAGSHCRWCKAKASCPALYALTQETASLTFSVVEPSPPAPSSLTEEQLQFVLQHAKVIEDWLKSVKTLAIVRAHRGDMPGWKLVSKKRHRKWTDADAVIELLGPEAYEKKLKSVAQIEKMVGKKNMDTLVPYFSNESSGTLLVPEADARPAIPSSTPFAVIEDNDDEE